MSEIKNISEYLSYDDIIEKAVEKIQDGADGFKKYKNTSVFKKLLGVYSPKKDEEVPDDYKLNADKGDMVALCIATGIAQKVSETLISFCRQSGNFAYKVLTNPKSFTHCIAYLVSKVVYDQKNSKGNASISDVETYENAIKFFIPEGSLSFQLNLDIPDFQMKPLSSFEAANLQLDYRTYHEKAEEELAIEAEKKAKREAEKKLAAQKKKESEEKKKVREQLKKEKEAFEKAQQSILPADATVITEKPKVTPKPKTKSKAPILSMPQPEPVQQLTLFV